MKHTLVILCGFFCFLMTNVLVGQIDQQEVTMSLGKHNALVLELNDVDQSKAEKLMKKYFKDYGKFDKNKKAKEYVGEGMTIESINGSNPIDMYVKLDELKEMTRVYVWMDLKGEFLSSENKSAYSGAEDVLNNFATFVKRTVVEEELAVEEKSEKEMVKSIGKLEKDNAKYHSEIEKAKELIAKMEKNIEDNVAAQEKSNIELEVQREAVEKVKERLNAIGKVAKKKM